MGATVGAGSQKFHSPAPSLLLADLWTYVHLFSLPVLTHKPSMLCHYHHHSSFPEPPEATGAGPGPVRR